MGFTISSSILHICRLEGETGILINGSVEGRKDHTQPEVKEHEVYAVDVLVSSGKGTCKLTSLDTTIYKLEQVHYSLKSKRSRHFFNYANNQFQFMPFNLRSLIMHFRVL